MCLWSCAEVWIFLPQSRHVSSLGPKAVAVTAVEFFANLSPFTANTMKLKLTLLIISLAQLAVAALRRNPRVYNALITTDQNLRSSRAYPVIQPHIEYPTIPYGAPLDPTWLSPYNPYYASAGYPGGHHPYYANYPIGLGPQIGFDGRPLDDDHHADGYRPQSPANKGSDGQNQNGQSKNDENENDNSSKDDKSSRGDQPSSNGDQSSSSEDQNDRKNQQQSPLPLNEFGLPPNLVPINPLQNAWNLQRHDPINLSPYPYNSYPLIYDHIPSYQPSAFLPPYGLFTPELAPGRRHQPSQRQPGQGKRDKQQPKKDEKEQKDKNANEEKQDEKDQQKENEEKKKQQDEQNQKEQQDQQQDQNNKDESSQQDQKEQPQKRRQAKQDRLLSPIVVGNSAMAANIKNFDPINRNVPDVPPPPPPSGAKDTVA